MNTIDYEDKISDLESELEDSLAEIEEHVIDINIIIKSMKEENQRASECDGHEANDLAQFNLYQIEQIEKLANSLNFEKKSSKDILEAADELRTMIKVEDNMDNLEQ